jgi:hypothetical protein
MIPGFIFKKDNNPLNTWRIWKEEIHLLSEKGIIKKVELNMTPSQYEISGIRLDIDKGDQKLRKYSGKDNAIMEGLADSIATKVLSFDCEKNQNNCQLDFNIFKSLCKDLDPLTPSRNSVIATPYERFVNFISIDEKFQNMVCHQSIE